MPRHLSISAQYRTEDGLPIVEHLDALATKWSEAAGKTIPRQAVIKVLLEAALKEHPVTDDEKAKARAKAAAGRRAADQPARPHLTLATIDGKRYLVEEVKGRGDAGSVFRKGRFPNKVAA